ncbi:MAG: phosphoserine phosphatase SerB [Rhizobiales bacterium 32-66-11]|nr:MAG: phosphoserine phosphatase SerB [Rhizobiales bacterium 32-66-11]
MVYVATLIANPSDATLTREMVHAARAVLPGAEEERVLAADVAVDIPFDPELGADTRTLADSVRTALAGAQVDVVVQLAAARRKRLFIADMDSTMIGQECIDELADVIGIKAHVAAITERAMRGEIAFEPALRERVALLKGLPIHVVGEVLRSRISLTPGGAALVATMKANGAYTALVSGGFTLFTDAVAGLLGFDENRANRLVVEADLFAGVVEEPILGRDAKTASLVELRDRLHLSPSETLAVGDGANDLGRKARRFRAFSSPEASAQFSGMAANWTCPSASEINSRADFLPSFFRPSTRFCTSSGLETVSWPTSTTICPGLRPLSAAGELRSTFRITTPLTVSLILKRLRRSSLMGASSRPSDFLASGFAASAPGALAAAAAFSSSGMRAIFRRRVSSLPLRTTTTSTSLSTAVSATRRGRSRISFTSLPSKRTTTSPALRPAFAAGPPSLTPPTRAPRGLPRPRLSAISSLTLWMRTPIQPRRTSLNCSSWAITGVAVEDGTAKPMPIDPPEGEMIAVLMPMTSPSMLNSGPPELPRLMAASVCRKLSYGPALMLRLRAETTPTVRVPPRPNGLPMAITQSPTRILSESPNFTEVSGLSGFTRNSARSVFVSRPISSALSLEPSLKLA